MMMMEAGLTIGTSWERLNWQKNPVRLSTSSSVFIISSTIVPRIPRLLRPLAAWLRIPSLPTLVSQFLYEQFHPDLDVPVEDVPSADCLHNVRVRLYPSAVATYYAPSDKSGMGGMCRERIWSVHSWMGGPGRHDCVFITHNEDLAGFRVLYVGRVLAFLKITHEKVEYPAALISWFETVGSSPCPYTRMWKVHHELDETGRHKLKVIHLDSVLCAAHLVGVAGSSFIPYELNHTNALDAYKTFYVNKYIDYHAHEIAF